MTGLYHAHRLTKDLGFRSLADYLQDPQANEEMPGWIEYLKIEDEMWVHRIARAIVLAFNGDGSQQPGKGKSQQQDEDDEEIIDTTDPRFSEQFQGFINAPGPAAAGQRPGGFQGRPIQPTSTQIIMG